MFSTIFLDKFYPGQSCHSCWYSQSNDANPSVFWQGFFAIRWRWYVTWKKITKAKQQKQPSNQKNWKKKHEKLSKMQEILTWSHPNLGYDEKGNFKRMQPKPRVEAGFGFRTSTGSCLLGTAFTSESKEFGATKLRFWMTIIDCNHQSIYIYNTGIHMYNRYLLFAYIQCIDLA